MRIIVYPETRQVNERVSFKKALRKNAEDIAHNWMAYVEKAKEDEAIRNELLGKLYMHIKLSDKQTFQLIPQSAILGVTKRLEEITPDHAESIRSRYLIRDKATRDY